MISLTLLVLIFSSSASARDVKQAECVGPATAPVTAIYLHGFDLSRESGNRARLEAFANRQNVRIAIPISRGISRTGKKEWKMGSIANTFKNIEFQATTVCNSALSSPRAMIGFTDGGVFVRDLAFECSRLTKDYSALVMSGVKPKTPDYSMKKCTRLVAARGMSDDATDICHNEINKKKKKMMRICIPFKVAVEKMKTRYSEVETEIFPGKRILPPDDVLVKYIPIPQNSDVEPSTN